MRQEADEARHAQPFALARGYELVEDDLGAIGEITELGFPERQGIRLGERIAVFEGEHGLFREHRVDHLVARLAFLDVIERRETVFGILIDEHAVALGEGAALAVLAG